jgi:hypothetical protein
VAKKGAICPIFEGDMPPKKMFPQYWRQYWRHNRNPVNIFYHDDDDDVMIPPMIDYGFPIV